MKDKNFEEMLEEIRAVSEEEDRKRTEGEIKISIHLLKGRRGWTYIVNIPEETHYKSLNWYDSAFEAIKIATTVIKKTEETYN